MPEKGWSILTVREGTAKRVKETAHARVDCRRADKRTHESNSEGKLASLQPLWSRDQVQEPAGAHVQGASQTVLRMRK